MLPSDFSVPATLLARSASNFSMSASLSPKDTKESEALFFSTMASGPNFSLNCLMVSLPVHSGGSGSPGLKFPCLVSIAFPNTCICPSLCVDDQVAQLRGRDLLALESVRLHDFGFDVVVPPALSRHASREPLRLPPEGHAMGRLHQARSLRHVEQDRRGAPDVD